MERFPKIRPSLRKILGFPSAFPCALPPHAAEPRILVGGTAIGRRFEVGRRVGVLGITALLCGTAAAQTTGRIEGAIQDAAGGPLPGVTVEASGPKLQGRRTAQTDSGGRYRLPELPPGPYAVRASLSGFFPIEKSVTVMLDSPLTLDLVLEVALAENVTVSAEARPLDVASTTTGTSYTSAVEGKLPVARNYSDIVRANPGVSLDKGETEGRAIPLSIYGATSVENQWIIDGINTTNVIKGFQGKAINNEFIEEVEVKTGGYQAEYGGALGGIVNVITRSGGNTYHGEGFAYYDSNATTADRTVTDQDNLAGMKITPNQRWDYGVDLGGYILKDKLWFFGAYNRVDTPGTTSRYFSTNQDPPLVPSTMLFPYNQSDNLYSGKLSWNIAAGSSLVATAFSDPSTISGAATVGTFSASAAFGEIISPEPGTWLSRRQIGGADYGARFSQLFGASAVLSLEASRHQDRFELIPARPGEVQVQDWTCAGGTPEFPCEIPFDPNTVSGGLGSLGGDNQRNSSQRGQIRGDATLYRGDHEVRAGGSYQNAKTTSVDAFTGGQTVSVFNDFGQTYYQHVFFSYAGTELAPATIPLAARSIESAAYLQDTWRPIPSLTVSAGLRWGQQQLRNGLGETVVNTGHEWQPRLGLVWDPTGKGQAKVYGFAGRFYYSMPTSLTLSAAGTEVYALTYNFSTTDVAQSPDVIGHPGADLFAVSPHQPVDAGLGGTYQDELTLGVEGLLDPGFTVGLKGTYCRLGRMVEDRCDLDPSSPENNGSSCATINPGSSGRYARGDFFACNGLNPGYGDACFYGTASTPAAKRVYRGIELLVRKAIEQRLWLQASYVYSSLEGNFDGGINENFGVAETDPGHNADFDYPSFWYQSYGRLFLDRPNSARLDVSYTASFGLFAGVGAYAQSGAPISRRGYFNEVYGGANIFLLPRGEAGKLPTLWEASLTVGYPVAVGPVSVTLQAYVYNLFNNQLNANQSMSYTNQQTPGYPGNLYDPVLPPEDADLVNPNYGKILNRQEPRLFRAAVRVSF